MSLGSSFPSVLGNLACNYAYYMKNVLIVAASGNDAGSTPCYPAGFNSVIAVGAVDDDLDIAYFSNRGNELVAPGVDILSLKKGTNDGYISYSGTSMAAPHVAGVAALCFAELGKKDPYKVRSILDKNAADLGDEDTYGYGLVDADASVNKCSVEVSSGQQVLKQQSSSGEQISNQISNVVLKFLSHTQKIFNFLPYYNSL
jgi:subtilisin